MEAPYTTAGEFNATQILRRSPSFEHWLKPVPDSSSSVEGSTSFKISSDHWQISLRASRPQELSSSDWIGTTKTLETDESSYCKPPPPFLKVPHLVTTSSRTNYDFNSIAAPSPPPQITDFPEELRNKAPKHEIMLLPPTRNYDNCTGLKRKEITFQKSSHEKYGNKYLKTINEGNALYCQVCRVNCASRFNLKQHLKGRQHESKLQGKQLLLANSFTTTHTLRSSSSMQVMNNLRCDVCQIWCPDRNAMNMHLKGKKHKARL